MRYLQIYELRQMNRQCDYDEVGCNYIKYEIYGVWVKGFQFMGLLFGFWVVYNFMYIVEKVSIYIWFDCFSVVF